MKRRLPVLLRVLLGVLLGVSLGVSAFGTGFAQAPSEVPPSEAPNEVPPEQETPPTPTPNEAPPQPAPSPEAPNEAPPNSGDPSAAPNEVPVAPDPAADPAAPPSEPPSTTPSTLPEGHEPVIHVELTPDSGLMTGDVLTLTLRVTTPARDDVTIPRGQSFAPFEVLRRPTPRVEVQGDRATHVIELELLALEPGDHELPPVTLRIVTAEGVVGEVETAPLRVPVGSVLGNEPNAEPKPPTEPVEVWEDDYTLAWVLGGLGLVLLGALLAWLFTRWWRRRVKAAAPPPPPRPPWEVAIEKLEALRLDRDAAVREERVVAWVDQVSDALREYLGRRYEFDGLESTTDEVVAELRKRKLIGLSLDEVIALLRDCDLVKFAKAPLGVEESDLLLAGAFRVVRTSAPITGMSAMGPVSMGPAASPDAGATAGPDGRWMPQTFDPAAPWTPPGATPAPTPPVAPTGDARWMPPDAEATSSGAPPTPASEAPTSGTPTSETPTSGTAASGTPASEAPATTQRDDASAAPSASLDAARLGSTFEPRLDPPGAVIAPTPEPRPIPPTMVPEAPAEPALPMTRPPAEPAERPIPMTMPPAEGPATIPETRFHTLPGFADPASPSTPSADSVAAEDDAAENDASEDEPEGRT